jgi:hypothetical protein
MLISDIIAEVISEVGGDSSDTALSTKVYGYLKSALRRLPKEARNRCLVAILEQSIADQAVSLSLPTDFLDERDVWYVSEGKRQPIDFLERKKFNDTVNTNSSGTPVYYSVYGKTLEFDKKLNGAFTIGIEYYKSVWNVLTTDTFFGFDDLIEPLKDLIKFYYYNYAEDKSSAAGFLSLAKASLGDIDSDFMEEEQGGYVEEA